MPRKTLKSQAFGGTALQHDAGEFITFIMDVLHDELNFNRDKPDYQKQLGLMTEQEQDARNTINVQLAIHQEWQRYLAGDNSLISHLCHGQRVYVLECSHCRKSTKQWQNFQMLLANFPEKYSVPGAPRSIGLVDLLRTSYTRTATELIEESKCDGCNMVGTRRSSLWVSRFPDYLIIECVRFWNRHDVMGKVSTHVTFPDMLDLTEFFIPITGDAPGDLKVLPEQKGPFIYDCYGVTQHFGSSLQGGHWIANARSLDKANTSNARQWHEFNDSTVKKSRFEATQGPSSHATHIFLKRRRAF